MSDDDPLTKKPFDVKKSFENVFKKPHEQILDNYQNLHVLMSEETKDRGKTWQTIEPLPEMYLPNCLEKPNPPHNSIK